MAVDLTLRLVKGTELTFAEIDNNWQFLDHAIDSNDSYYKGQINNLELSLTLLESKFDSNLDSAVNKIIRDHDSDMEALLQEHDSDINWLITNGSARHDSEHAWNVQEHAKLDSDLTSKIDSNYYLTLNYIDSSLGEVVGGLTIDSVPPDASEGEMWLDTTKDQVYINDGDVWFEFPGPSDVYGIMLVTDSTPTNPVNGTLWLDTVDDTVKIYDGDVWFEFPYPDMSMDSALIASVVDSGYINSIIPGATDHWDSAATISLVDSAYVQARQVDIYRDSAFVTNIVDSDYLATTITRINGGTY